MERREFLSKLFLQMPFGIFIVSVFSQCGEDLDSLNNKSPNNTNSDSGLDLNGKSIKDDQNSPIRPTQNKISVLEDLKKRVEGRKIEIIFGDNGDPYVKSITDLGSDCLYFTVNGKPFIGEGINVESVFINPEEDRVEWYCNGHFLGI